MVKQLKMMKIDDETFLEHASRFCLLKSDMEAMGYPYRSVFSSSYVVVYKSPRDQSQAISQIVYNVNTMKEYESDLKDSDSPISRIPNFSVSPTLLESLPPRKVVESKTCTRCSKEFFISAYEYITKNKCQYHWGRLQNVYQPNKKVEDIVFSCCKREAESPGCSLEDLHVWSGFNNGHNIFDSSEFVETTSSESFSSKKCHGMYAIDCEMCYTIQGLELTKVTVVGMDGQIVYDEYVRPKSQIVDYNTRFSGISEETFKSHPTKTLKQVQSDLLTFINAETILIGHGLENDLFALKLLHKTVIDTAQLFPHFHGLPYRRSLKNLMFSILAREIQTSDAGHNSSEDALACMELILWKMMKHV